MERNLPTVSQMGLPPGFQPACAGLQTVGGVRKVKAERLPMV